MHLYISNSPTEIDCISVRESLVCGAVPVLGNDYVFKERDGIHVPGNTDDPATYKRAGTTVVKYLNSQPLLAAMRAKLKASKTIISWDAIAKQWLLHI